MSCTHRHDCFFLSILPPPRSTRTATLLPYATLFRSGLGNLARDTWISTELRSTLLCDQDVSSIDYSIETVNQVIYLMGVAQSQAELDRVIGHAKSIAYVRRVISYVLLEDDPARHT